METKKCKDELFERFVDDLRKWAEVDEAHRSYMLVVKNEETTTTVLHSTMLDQVMMLCLSTIDSPETACVIKNVAALIDRLMQSEPIYQKFKDDTDFSEYAKNMLFMHYFKQAIERKKVNWGEALSKSSDTNSDDEDDNEEEQS